MANKIDYPVFAHFGKLTSTYLFIVLTKHAPSPITAKTPRIFNRFVTAMRMLATLDVDNKSILEGKLHAVQLHEMWIINFFFSGVKWDTLPSDAVICDVGGGVCFGFALTIGLTISPSRFSRTLPLSPSQIPALLSCLSSCFIYGTSGC